MIYSAFTSDMPELICKSAIGDIGSGAFGLTEQIDLTETALAEEAG